MHAWLATTYIYRWIGVRPPFHKPKLKAMARNLVFVVKRSRMRFHSYSNLQVFVFAIGSVSYTHLTLPTNREV